VREVRNNKGYEAESNAINTFHDKARAKTLFTHKNHEDVIQLPTGHNGVL